MVAVGHLLYFGIFGLHIATQVSYSCVTEENLSKGMKETSCVHLALTSVPMKGIPQDTGILILSFNSLKAISTSAFKGIKGLVELDLSDNVLTSFKVDLPIMLQELNLANNSFKEIPNLSQLTSLTRLVLSNNRISAIPNSAFKGLQTLKVLELQKNAIDSLSGEVFNDLNSLDHLDLSCNQLWELPSHLISSLVRLEKFYLTGNKLTNIPDDFFLGLDALAYVYLDKNAWICNCALQYFKEWVEENGHNIYYLSDGSPVNEEKSVLCSDGTPLIDYNMPDCGGNGLGDVDQHIIQTTIIMPETKKITLAPTTIPKTTEPWITTFKTTTPSTTQTTPVLTTQTQPTSVAMTTQTERSTSPTLYYLHSTVKESPVTTAWTTRIITTTPLKTTIMTTTETKRTSIYPSTTLHPTSSLPTTVTVAPSTVMTTLSTPGFTTTPVNVTDVPTSATVTETPFTSTEMQLLYTMELARASRAEAHGMSWLEYNILKNCCFLHLILYILGLLLLLVQMIVSLCLLVWTHTHLYRHYQALVEKMPNIRLIRYSLRAPVNDDEILLVRDIESNFSEQSFAGVTRMLVLEASTRDQEKIYTSAIL